MPALIAARVQSQSVERKHRVQSLTFEALLVRNGRRHPAEQMPFVSIPLSMDNMSPRTASS
jgi:hypothetical protein